MFTKWRLLLDLWKYEQGKPGNADMAVQVIYHFNGKSKQNQMRVWAATPTGKRYLAGERILDDIESFRERDPNTLGAKYLEFRDKYRFGEVRDELPSMQDKYPDELEAAYGLFMQDAHDFTHVITGYPPDTLGELMRIKVYKKYEGRGWAIVDYMGWLWYHTKLIKEVKKYKKLAREAEETSRFVKNYILEDWFKLLGTHINKVRQNLSTNSSILHNWERT